MPPTLLLRRAAGEVGLVPWHGAFGMRARHGPFAIQHVGQYLLAVLLILGLAFIASGSFREECVDWGDGTAPSHHEVKRDARVLRRFFERFDLLVA